MKRQISMEEISDGKLYSLNDLVKAGCNDCKGCFACCQGMGNSIVLDPLDVYMLYKNLNQTTEELLLTGKLELQVVDGIILPNLKMGGEKEQCAFLNKEGRCSIHAFRPGICRLFPLGRFYENGSFRYFLQIYECKNKNRTKVKVRKWIDMPEIGKYEKFINDWHYFLKDLEERLEQASEEECKRINMVILQTFYFLPFEDGQDFYMQFEERLKNSFSQKTKTMQREEQQQI